MDITEPELQEALEAADGVNRKLREILEGPYGDGDRTIVVLGYWALSIEHHSAIFLLFKDRHFGSALVLGRSIFEAMIRAHWLVKCASQEQLKFCLENDQGKFPAMKEMAQAVDVDYSDPRGGAMTKFQDAVSHGWPILNSYTHSGLRQLACRFKGDQVQPNYSTETLVDALNTSTVPLRLLATLLAMITGRQDKFSEILALP